MGDLSPCLKGGQLPSPSHPNLQGRLQQPGWHGVGSSPLKHPPSWLSPPEGLCWPPTSQKHRCTSASPAQLCPCVLQFPRGQAGPSCPQQLNDIPMPVTRKSMLTALTAYPGSRCSNAGSTSPPQPQPGPVQCPSVHPGTFPGHGGSAGWGRV